MENQEYLKIAREKSQELKTPLKMVKAERNEEGTLILFFEAEKRVDFRALVQELNQIFNEPIRLEQIGARDSAKIIGGIGPCGKPLCCHRFLTEFKSITTDIIKAQNLNNSLSEYTGSCGKLMCCLSYECCLDKMKKMEEVKPEGKKVKLAQKKESEELIDQENKETKEPESQEKKETERQEQTENLTNPTDSINLQQIESEPEMTEEKEKIEEVSEEKVEEKQEEVILENPETSEVQEEEKSVTEEEENTEDELKKILKKKPKKKIKKIKESKKKKAKILRIK